MATGRRTPGFSGLRYLGVGISFGAYVALGGYLGYLGEQHFHTGPWLRLVGIMAGIALGTWDLIRVGSALERLEKKQEQEDKEPPDRSKQD